MSNMLIYDIDFHFRIVMYVHFHLDFYETEDIFVMFLLYSVPIHIYNKIDNIAKLKLL